MAVSGSGTRVIKSSGETEVFDPNIITSDCVEAGVEFWTAAEVAMEVSKDVFDGINSEEIQRKILKVLYNRNPEIAERYKRFHSMYVRTSNNTIERFNRKKIVDSLVIETTLPKEVAEIIAKETESELRRLNLDFTSGPLIREIVNVKLLEHGYEGARSDYTRLGMPVYDAAKFIESGSESLGTPEAVHREMANSILTEYSLLKVLPLHLADAHMNGDLYVHDLEYFVSRPYTAMHDLRHLLRMGLTLSSNQKNGLKAGPAKNAQTAVLHSIMALRGFGTAFSSSQGLHSYNVWLAPYLQGLSENQIKQLSQTCMFEIAQSTLVSGRAGIPLDLDIDYGIPDCIREVPAILPGGKVNNKVVYGDFESEARIFAQALLDSYKKGDYGGRVFPSPRMTFKFRKENDDKGGFDDFKSAIHETASNKVPVNILNLITSGYSPITSSHSSGITFDPDSKFHGNLVDDLRWLSLQRLTLNLPRVAYRSGGKEEQFFELLEDLLVLGRETAMVKKDIIDEKVKRGSFKFIGQKSNRGEQGLDNSSILISYVGLNEAVKIYLGEELHESKYAQEFANLVLSSISKFLSEISDKTEPKWLLSSTSETLTAKRFALLDSGQFSDASLLKEGSRSKKVTYTNSCHVSPKANISFSERLEIESGFYKISSGGMINKVPVKERKSHELESLSDDMQKSRIGNWSFIP